MPSPASAPTRANRLPDPSPHTGPVRPVTTRSVIPDERTENSHLPRRHRPAARPAPAGGRTTGRGPAVAACGGCRPDRRIRVYRSIRRYRPCHLSGVTNSAAGFSAYRRSHAGRPRRRSCRRLPIDRLSRRPACRQLCRDAQRIGEIGWNPPSVLWWHHTDHRINLRSGSCAVLSFAASFSRA